MIKESWGLLGGEQIASVRRARSLGLGAAVRAFNEMAVPGLGGVWYGKQVLLAALGLAVAAAARNRGKNVRNIEVANAIEALACYLCFRERSWQRDPRARGNTKLRNRGDDLRFDQVSRPGFYVSQPMRMATVPALPALGIAAGTAARFNAYKLTEFGQEFVEVVSTYFRPYNRTLIDHLAAWVCAGNAAVKVDSSTLADALSPVEPLLPRAAALLREALQRPYTSAFGDADRRSRALRWVDTLRRAPTPKRGWAQRPQEVATDHWFDLQAGAKFFALRNAALKVLDELESELANRSSGALLRLETEPVPDAVADRVEQLTRVAQGYRDLGHGQPDASTFASDCLRPRQAEVLEALIRRDGVVLRLENGMVRPGPAFGERRDLGDLPLEEAEPTFSNVPLPHQMSYRMRNLYVLNLDLGGELNRWLGANLAEQVV